MDLMDGTDKMLQTCFTQLCFLIVGNFQLSSENSSRF